MNARQPLRAVIFVALATLVFAGRLPGQDWTSKRFAFPADDVYKSAVRVISLHYEIKFKDAENRVIRFHVGTTAWSWGYNMGLTVQPQANGTSLVRVAIEKSGGPAFSWSSGKKEVLKIYRWMEDDLLAARSAEPSPQR